MTTKQDHLIIEGRLFWASVHTPNSHSGKYQVDISVDDATAATLTSLGVPVKKEADHVDSNGVKGKYVGTENDRKTYVTAKRSTEAKDGIQLQKATIIDAKKQPLGAETALGNGTKARVKVNPFEWNFKGKKGVSLGFSVIQVLDLVEFKQSGLDGFETTEGYTGTLGTVQNTETSTDDEDPFAMTG
tara:strand:+ start:354 stop:914 length:561 start_codon:yes stop_codon:yes gene_type:complete